MSIDHIVQLKLFNMITVILKLVLKLNEYEITLIEAKSKVYSVVFRPSNYKKVVYTLFATRPGSKPQLILLPRSYNFNYSQRNLSINLIAIVTGITITPINKIGIIYYILAYICTVNACVILLLSQIFTSFLPKIPFI